MRTIFVAALLLSSLAAHAQSFLLQATGRLLTIDKQGFIYDLQLTVDPESIKEQGKNWFKTKDTLSTISATGLVTEKTGLVLPRSIKAHGGTWLIGNRSEFLVVAEDGMVYSYNEPLMRDVKVVSSGANWLVIRAKDKSFHMVTIDTLHGRYYTTSSMAMAQGPLRLNTGMIRHSGGNWFIDSNGVLFVVRNDGGILSKRELGIFVAVTAKGGNFFIDIRNRVQVILDNGYVALPYLPMVFGSLVKTGAQVAWNTRGDFFTFAEAGAASEANAFSDNAVMDRLLRFIIKQPMNEQVDPRSLAE